ncbi:MAG TPA: hypothetical protein VFE25_03835 [Opitutaceae bacterium]|nr:hypothetical protein [Opitutaceae bacterium]
MTRRTLTAITFMALATLGLGATPSKQEVLDAIGIMEKGISGPGANAAAKTIVVYAQVSDDVMVNIGEEQLPWVSEKWDMDDAKFKSCQSLLMAAFVAGNIKSQLKSQKAVDDTYSGWLFAIDTYRRLRARDSFRSPAIEALSKMQSEGKLQQHAKDLQASEEEQDPQDNQPRPLALSGLPGPSAS